MRMDSMAVLSRQRHSKATKRWFSYGWTPLHCRARKGRNAVARVLLERGIDLEARDVLGWMALHWAAHNGHATTLQLLLEHDREYCVSEGSLWLDSATLGSTQRA